jgi:hypothetical protein
MTLIFQRSAWREGFAAMNNPSHRTGTTVHTPRPAARSASKPIQLVSNGLIPIGQLRLTLVYRLHPDC